MDKKRLLTIADLIEFCESHKMYSFNSKDAGKPIVVQVDQLAYFEEENTEKSDGFLHLRFKVAHIDKNSNGSGITKENMEKNMGTLKYRPVLASIIPSPNDESVLDFNGHDMEIDDDGNVKYIESQVGCFTVDEPYLQYDKDKDKTYVIAYAVIPEDYTETANIIRRKGGTKVSCELLINELSYDAVNKYLNLIDFSFQGVTLLGEHVSEGMLGSRADITSIESFSEENNSIFSQNIQTKDFNTKLIETLEKINSKLDDLSNFNINVANENLEEGGSESVTKLEELMQKYNKSQDDITFETEGLSDEELESKFAEVFNEVNSNSNESDQEPVITEPENLEPEQTESEDPDTVQSSFENNEPVCHGIVRTYEVSHEDIRYALYNLLVPYEETDNEYYWIVSVYNDYFVYQGYRGNYYGQKYSVKDDSVSFEGERYELFVEYLTESEKAELENMRSNYSSIQSELNSYKTNEMNAKKEEILSDEAYSEFADTDEFKQIKEKVSEYSLDELRTVCELAFAKLVKLKGTFSYEKNDSNEKKQNKIVVNMTSDINDNKDPYGDYFKSLKERY